MKRFVQGLQPGLPAAVLVALHLPSESESLLPSILQRRTALPVVAAYDQLQPQDGHVYVARPDSHLLVMADRVVLGQGARENGHRPSHDAMLRSLALSFGPRAVGLVLTGLLDDGAAGLLAVERYGGTCLVQDPDDAEFRSMPESALRAVPTARRVTLETAAMEVSRAVENNHLRAVRAVPPEARTLDELEVRSALGELPIGRDGEPLGTPSPYGCPECHGVLNTMPDPGTNRFRCRTGHAWSAESLMAQQGMAVENALWAALRILEERVQMATALAQEAADAERPWSEKHYRRRAEEAEQSAASLRALLLDQVSRTESGGA